MIRAAIVGGAGYIGGELLRLLLGHPEVEVVASTSARLAGRRVDGSHPNLRGLTDLVHSSPDALPDCDAVFFASSGLDDPAQRAALASRAKLVFDLSADLRLTDPALFAKHYGAHPTPDLLGTATRGLPEVDRAALRTANLVSVPGCMATAGILGLRPLVEFIDGPVTVDGRVGSSGSGASAGEMNLHAERANVLRVFAPLGHRHQAEISQATGLTVRMTATGVDAVRGVQVLCRTQVRAGVTETDIRKAYRAAYADEPFVRVVAQKRGNYRLPEPKILLGSNFCDVGFALDADTRELLVVGALDNLVKGGSGNAVQSLNIRMGWDERLGLGFPGLHPV
ncbi:N-acetyl-gamma-glutamyl-phosphate reductase [Goodfellowiella coeruleoviolacea]|uniref:N-acetyl-gamma-glutamyl-phosphate reductase n=1 Tax=Goodfellowiella coeruleoviolacea TaxID=334858 RepID=A0AAE3KLU0_9PSEU|nr:N-acetyl-gamma-glutamyl-phosphate reductase [Goodfellowiella coeruleoviolacea]MCP2166898.1 N-acetyl-gamma-glutamyl-phosphate reductase [Goodfellowiella coeruleoviolacea]